MTENTETQYIPKLREILVWPDDRLHQESKNVTEFDSSLERLVADMFVTMTANGGVGMAAPQIGEFVNVITIRIESDKNLVLINPEIISASEDMFEFEEGCLSVPGYFEKRERPKQIAVRFKDVDGNEQELDFFDIYAFAIQHEIDHLKGKVFVDGASMFKQSRIKRKIKRALKQRNEMLKYLNTEIDALKATKDKETEDE